MADNVNITQGAGTVISTDDLGGIQVQRVKVQFGVDGSASDVNSATPLPVDTELPAASALGDAEANPTVPRAAAMGMDWNGATWDRRRALANLEGTALTSTPRTTTAAGTSADLLNFVATGLHVILNVTVGAALSLTLGVEAKDPASGTYYQLNANPTAVTTTGVTIYELFPGVGAATGLVTQRTSATLPKTWRIKVTHGNANSATYSVGYCLLLG